MTPYVSVPKPEKEAITGITLFFNQARHSSSLGSYRLVGYICAGSHENAMTIPESIEHRWEYPVNVAPIDAV